MPLICMPDYIQQHDDHLRRYAGKLDLGLLNKVLVAILILLMAWWLLTPVRSMIGTWVGYKSRDTLVAEVAQKDSTIEQLMVINRNNDAQHEIRKDVDKIAETVLTEEKAEYKQQVVQTRERVKQMRDKIETIKTQPPDPAVNVNDRISEEIIDSLWDNFNALNKE